MSRRGFFLPQLVTLAAHSYLTSHGAQLTGCGIERKSSAVFRIPDCTLQSSISTSELRLQLHELTLSFDTLRALLRLGPNIAIDTLNLRVSNRGASSEKESGGGSMPFFLRFQFKMARLLSNVRHNPHCI